MYYHEDEVNSEQMAMAIRLKDELVGLIGELMPKLNTIIEFNKTIANIGLKISNLQALSVIDTEQDTTDHCHVLIDLSQKVGMTIATIRTSLDNQRASTVQLNWIAKTNDLESMRRNLIKLTKPYTQLNVTDRYQRLVNILDGLILTDTKASIKQGQNILRIVVVCLQNDADMSSEQQQEISRKITEKIEASQCMQYLSLNEYYSLLMLILSGKITDKQITHTLSKKIVDMPTNNKVLYYSIFIEMIDMHGKDAATKDTAIEFIRKQCWQDMKKHEHDDKLKLFKAIDTMLTIRQQQYKRDRSKDGCIDHINELKGVANQYTDTMCVYHKLRIILQAELLQWQLGAERSRPCSLSFWSIGKASADQCYQEFTTYLWQEPTTNTKYYEWIYEQLENADTKDPKLFIELMAEIWPSGQDLSDSYHARYLPTNQTPQEHEAKSSEEHRLLKSR